MAKAYFKCVNDNGGINGRPIEYVIETEQTDPGQAASLAKKLIETDKVARHRRQHEHHRVRGQPQVLRVARTSTSSAPASRPSATRRRTSRR